MIKSTEYNLHTHSFYCRHGHGGLASYAEEAERLGLTLLGFSEHCPRPDKRFAKSRMFPEEMVVYEKDARGVAELHPNMTILLGYECDYSVNHQAYYEDLLSSGRVEYLITGTHFIKTSSGFVSPFKDILTKEQIYFYLDSILEAMHSGLFSFVAHPDLYLAGYRSFDNSAEDVAKKIIEAAIELKLPLEVNGNGMLKPSIDGRYAYPVKPFWTLASEMGAKAVFNTDAHEVENLGKTRELLKTFIKENNIELVYPSVEGGKLCFS